MKNTLSPVETDLPSNPFDPSLPPIKSSLKWTALIFLAALAVRWIPVTYAMPYIHYWDEPTYLKLVLTMQKTGKFDHRWYNIPPFFLYQHVAVQTLRIWNKAKTAGLEDVQGLDISGVDNRDFRNPSILRWSRKYTILLGALMCAITFLLARKFFSERIAIASGFALAFMPGHIEHSLFITPDIPMAFMALVTVYFCIKSPSPVVPSYVFCLGILAGLTATAKYNGGLVLLVPCVLLLLDRTSDLRHWAVLLFGSCVGFTLGFPYWLSRLPDVINGIGSEIYHYNAFYLKEGITHRWGLDFLLYLISPGMGWILFPLLIVGLFAQLKRTWSMRDAAVLVFPVVYLLMVLDQKANIVRNLMPLTPWLAIGAGCGFVAVQDAVRARAFPIWRLNTATLITVLLILGIAVPPLRWGVAMNRTKETRVQMVDWISAQTPPESVIGIPNDLRFLDMELRRMQRPTILLSQPDVNQQTLRGIDVLICGLKPANMRWLSLWKGNGNLSPDTVEPRKRAEAIQHYVESLPSLHTVFPASLYPPRSTLDSFHEGYWLLDEWPVNPALGALKIEPKSPWAFEPIRDGSFTVDSWEFMPPAVDRSIRGNPLQINGIPYSTGFGVHANTVMRYPVPPGAKRFLADAGVSDDLIPDAVSSIQVTVLVVDQATYLSPILRRKSPAWRFDVNVEGRKEIVVSVKDAGDGIQFDNGVLGYNGFVFDATRVNNSQ